MGVAEALREEYRAIVDAGLYVQIDDAFVPFMYDVMVPPATIEDYRAWAQPQIDAVNHALEGIPPRARPLPRLLGQLERPAHQRHPAARRAAAGPRRSTPGRYLFEAANPRHEHEWRVWEDIELPAGKKLAPGVISHATNVVEHPELVAERLERIARLVGTGERHRRAPTAASPRAPTCGASTRRSCGPSSRRSPRAPRSPRGGCGGRQRRLKATASRAALTARAGSRGSPERPRARPRRTSGRGTACCGAPRRRPCRGRRAASAVRRAPRDAPTVSQRSWLTTFQQRDDHLARDVREHDVVAVAVVDAVLDVAPAELHVALRGVAQRRLGGRDMRQRAPVPALVLAIVDARARTAAARSPCCASAARTRRVRCRRRRP